ncbi:tetratricopeptide repeat protein [Prevotella sp.]|uniref:tetratricopeptide repeat protein n=1 Tax=Prevotella sp. TaxID=59823 RepID=UPI002647F7F6|nr:DUF3868 domain-containing protein [Prevotella sp.]MDN5554661.1 DUF3868 domain-containing protein [Prevotella sp.]
MKLLQSAFFLLTFCGVASAASAQTVYGGQIYVNSENFTRQGDLLRVRMKVSYDSSVVGSCEALTFTPVLKTDSAVSVLSSVVINGRERERDAHRTEVLSEVRRNIPIVVKDSHAAKRYFVYDTTVPYKDWMQDCRMYVESEELNCQGRKGHVYEDLVLKNIYLHDMSNDNPDPNVHYYNLMDYVQFLQPQGSDIDKFHRSGEISIFGNKSLAKLSGSRFNRTVFNTIATDVKSELQRYGTSLVGLRINGFGAPIGNYRRNESEAMERSLDLKKFLMKQKLTNRNDLNVSWLAEDWDSISSLVAGSGMNLRDAVVDIIKNIDVVNGREREIENLGLGMPYAYMNRFIFPKVYRIKYTLTFRHDGFDSNSAMQHLGSNPATMTLGELYATAGFYKKGSREYNDILDLTARLFPDNPEANINAAGVALTRNDVTLAHKYLKRWETDPRAYCNMGLLYLSEGNRDKAEVYLKMAKAAGVVQADRALIELMKMK